MMSKIIKKTFKKKKDKNIELVVLDEKQEIINIPKPPKLIDTPEQSEFDDEPELNNEKVSRKESIISYDQYEEYQKLLDKYNSDKRLRDHIAKSHGKKNWCFGLINTKKFSYMEQIEDYLNNEKDDNDNNDGLNPNQKEIIYKHFITLGKNVEHQRRIFENLKNVSSTLILICSTLTTALLSVDIDKYFWPVWVLSLFVTITKGTTQIFQVEKNFINFDTKLAILRQEIWTYLQLNPEIREFDKFCSNLHTKLSDIVGTS